MKLEQRETDTIQPYENNPRRNDQAVDAVAESIKAFGFRQPIVADWPGPAVAGRGGRRG